MNRPSWTKLEGATLAALATVAVAVWSFLALARYATGGAPAEMDRRILLAFRSSADPADPLGPPWFEEMVRDVTALGGLAPLALATLGVVGFLVLAGRRGLALRLGLWISVGVLLSFALKHLFDRPRPDLVPHLMRVSTASFPSGHAMLSTIVYVTLGATLSQALRGRLRLYVLLVAVVIASLVGLSRIYLGVHWPTDVAGGFAVGIAWAGLAWLAERRERRGEVRSAPDVEGDA